MQDDQWIDIPCILTGSQGVYTALMHLTRLTFGDSNFGLPAVLLMTNSAIPAIPKFQSCGFERQNNTWNSSGRF